MSRFRLPIRAVLYRDEESEQWISQCLEFGLPGSGDTQDEAIAMMLEAIGIQARCCAEDDHPDNLFSPADAWLFRLFAESFPLERAVSYPEAPTDFLAVEAVELRGPAVLEPAHA